MVPPPPTTTTAFTARDQTTTKASATGAALNSSTTMASRRGPLTENPNAANSPFRGHTATKRARSNTADVENEQSPPKKKHIIDASFNVSKPTLRSVFDDAAAVEKGTSRPPSSFQKRLLAERDSKPTSRPATQKPVPKAVEKVISNEGAADREALQNWKKHYRTAFPRFTFYFENIPPDNASRLSKQCLVLGAVCLSISAPLEPLLTFRSARREILLQGCYSCHYAEVHTSGSSSDRHPHAAKPRCVSAS